MPRVFVVQNPHRHNPNTGALEPRFDLTPAAEYGTLVFLLGPNAKPFTSEPVVADLRVGLSDYTDDDHLLLVGSPVLMGWACAIAADMNDGIVSILQWSGREQRYIPVKADLFPDED